VDINHRRKLFFLIQRLNLALEEQTRKIGRGGKINAVCAHIIFRNHAHSDVCSPILSMIVLFPISHVNTLAYSSYNKAR